MHNHVQPNSHDGRIAPCGRAPTLREHSSLRPNARRRWPEPQGRVPHPCAFGTAGEGWPPLSTDPRLDGSRRQPLSAIHDPHHDSRTGPGPTPARVRGVSRGSTRRRPPSAAWRRVRPAQHAAPDTGFARQRFAAIGGSFRLVALLHVPHIAARSRCGTRIFSPWR